MRPERCIVLLKQFLGDGVMSEPLLSTLADEYSHVDVLAVPSVQQVLKHLDGRVNFIHTEKIKTLRETMNQAKKLRRKSYDIAFLVNRSFRSAILGRLAKISVRVGHGTEGRSFLLTQSVTYHDEDFEAKSYADLAEAVGVNVPRLHPQLQVNELEQKRGRSLIAGATIAIQPGARWNYKRVPTALLVKVAEAAMADGHHVVLVGGEEEKPAAEELLHHLNDRAIDLVGRTNLRDTMAVLDSVRVAVGGDTGVMHLAAGLGTPTVTVFGPTPIIKWGHHYDPHVALQAPNNDLEQMNPEIVVEAAMKHLG